MGHLDDGSHLKELKLKILPGSQFGVDCLKEEAKPRRRYTAVAENAAVGHGCLCAKLTLKDFHGACVIVGAMAMRVLRRPPRLRVDEHLRMLLRMFQDSSFFKEAVDGALTLPVTPASQIPSQRLRFD